MPGDLESAPGSIEKLSIADLPPIDPKNARFPCCLVWTPLPVVAWLVPFLGHLGICREDGVILDFAGSYFINVDSFAFGAATRYVQLDPAQGCFPRRLSDHKCSSPATHSLQETATTWTDALRVSMRQFQHTTYNIFTCNCHSFVATCLNAMAYQGRTKWNMVDLVLMIVFKGKWVSYASILQSFLPSVMVAGLGLWAVGSSFLIGWAFFAVLLIGWFLVGTYILKGVLHP